MTLYGRQTLDMTGSSRGTLMRPRPAEGLRSAEVPWGRHTETKDRMRLRLIPRDEHFFAMFVEDAENVLKGARLLEEMLRSYDDLERRANDIEDVEHRGDELSHQIANKLNSTFVTPFDREDIHALISGLDDVLDGLEEAADVFVLYNVEEPSAAATKQATIIVHQVEVLVEALKEMQKPKALQKHLIEVHRLENEGDQIARAAIAALFHEKTKATDIIKWKEVYGVLEETIDRCEDVADILERIVVKHS